MSEATPERPRRKLAAILMADVSGFSRMMESHEERTVELIGDFHRRVRVLVERHEGRVVGTAGDSVFGEFASVLEAMRCARALQEEEATVNATRPPEERFGTRIGLHLGDVVVQDYQVYGDGVNIASRLESIAEPGTICLSEAVYQQIHKQLDLPLEDLGVRELRNIEHPIRVYRVPALGEPLPSATRPSRPAVIPSDDPASSATPWRRTSILVPGIVGVVLLASPVLFFSTGGALPTAGAIVLGTVWGRLQAARTGTRGWLLVGVGAGIAFGAVATGWSAVTNTLFLVVGAIVAAIGWSRR